MKVKPQKIKRKRKPSEFSRINARFGVQSKWVAGSAPDKINEVGMR